MCNTVNTVEIAHTPSFQPYGCELGDQLDGFLGSC
jgi:hypothetical protein